MKHAVSLVVALALICITDSSPAHAAPIFEQALFNGNRASAQVLGFEAFTLPVPNMVFDPPGWATATVHGFASTPDVDFYRFETFGGGAIFDIDGGLGTRLWLFNDLGVGTVHNRLIARSPVPGAGVLPDPGSSTSSEGFLGIYSFLPSDPSSADHHGVYYIAVSREAATVGAPILWNPSTCTGPSLVRPDGVFGGVASPSSVGCEVGLFPTDGLAQFDPYTLHVSLELPRGAPTAVPEPISLLLVGPGFGLLATLRRRRKQNAENI